jgi:hypothetical protein
MNPPTIPAATGAPWWLYLVSCGCLLVGPIIVQLLVFRATRLDAKARAEKDEDETNVEKTKVEVSAEESFRQTLIEERKDLVKRIVELEKEKDALKRRVDDLEHKEWLQTETINEQAKHIKRLEEALAIGEKP